MTTSHKIQIDPERDTQFKRLAKRIARYLFVNGFGHGTRLVMAFPNPKYGLALTEPKEKIPGDGWSESAVRRAVLMHLRRAEIAKLRKGPK